MAVGVVEEVAEWDEVDEVDEVEVAAEVEGTKNAPAERTVCESYGNHWKPSEFVWKSDPRRSQSLSILPDI